MLDERIQNLLKYSNEDLIKLLSSEDKYIQELVIDIIISRNIEKLTLPDNFIFNPDNKHIKIIKLLLNSASKEQLIPTNFDIYVIADSIELIDILCKKIVEFETDSFKDEYHILFNNHYSDYVKSLIMDLSNPLYITFADYTYLFKEEDFTIDIYNLYLNSIKNSENISVKDIVQIIKRLLDSELDKKHILLNNIVNTCKIDINEIFNECYWINNSVRRINNEGIKNIWKNCLLNQKNVNLSIAGFLDKENIENYLNNWDDNAFINNYNLLKDLDSYTDTLIYLSLYDKIKNRLNNGKNVGFYFLAYVTLYGHIQVDTDYFSYDNLILNLDNESVDLFIKLMSYPGFAIAITQKLANYEGIIPNTLININTIQYSKFKNIFIEKIKNDLVNLDTINDYHPFLQTDLLRVSLEKNKMIIKGIITYLIHNESKLNLGLA